MRADDAYPFIKNAIDGNSQFRLLNSDRIAMKMQLMKVEDDKSEHAFELMISVGSETICDLNFTIRSADAQKLAKIAQAMLGAISEYGNRTKAFWANEGIVPKQITDEQVERVIQFLRERPMSTIEEISDGVAMLQLTVAESLHELQKRGIALGRTQPKYFIK